MTKKVLLEILIPTFDRPSSAITAMQSVVIANDPRVGVRCQSNKPEPKLEKFTETCDAVVYDQFSTNLGPHKSSYKLLDDTDATFCMLLSDEDRISPERLEDFLDYLENIPDTCNAVSCAVFSEEENRFVYDFHESVNRAQVTLAGFTILSSSTYMSGYVFRVSALRAIDLKALKSFDAGNNPNGISHNVYSHIDITQQLLKKATCGMYGDLLVLQGKTVSHGGHAFSHREQGNDIVDDNLDLNPAVYGPFPRACQFFYREFMLTQLRNDIPPYSYLIARSRLYHFFMMRLIQTPRVVRLDDDHGVFNEAMRGIVEATSGGYFSGSSFCMLFADGLMGGLSDKIIASMATMDRISGSDAISKVPEKVIKLEWLKS